MFESTIINSIIAVVLTVLVCFVICLPKRKVKSKKFQEAISEPIWMTVSYVADAKSTVQQMRFMLRWTGTMESADSADFVRMSVRTNP